MIRKKIYRTLPLATFIFLNTNILSGCGIQSIPKAKNAVDAAQAEILNQYQRRSDLVPNLVEVVKGAAAQEKETLEAVVNARAKATQMQVNLNDAESMQKFQRAQSELGNALARLLVVSESYPQLKAMEGFRDLQVQLEGTENRITVARQRAITAILEFNNQVTVFPTSLTNSLMFHYQPLPQWGADKDVKALEQAPKVDFKK
jgi:LemA protein